MSNPIILAPALSEAHLELLLPCITTDFLAQEPSRPRRRSVSQDTVLSVVVEKLRTGLSWIAFKSGISAYNHFQSWSESGTVQALWWVISNNPELFGFCPKRLWAATSWLIKRDHINGPSENWLGKDFKLPKPPKPEFYGPKQEKKSQPAIYTFDRSFMELAIPFVLEAYPEKAKGRSRLSMQMVFNGLLFQIRTGCQGNLDTTVPFTSGKPSLLPLGYSTGLWH
ncbi:MAG: hypothetical protein NTX25_00095 [Proteobacteria bacterium]|nr:hypothetical protein [Pseudomonadota bacterium]